MDDDRSRVRGCLLGGAVGDSLGVPVEFLPWQRIRDVYGPDGITGTVLGPAGLAQISDDTQMTLFTVEGLLRAAAGAGDPAVTVHQAYLRWLDTQRLDEPPAHPDPGLASQRWLYAQRAPGNACVSGLRAGRMGTPERPQNPNSKGCGAVMRSAPFGLSPRATPEQAFALAAECATQTHGHPSGYLAAGAFAAIVRILLDGRDLRAAVGVALDLLARRPDHEEVTAALRAAMMPGGPLEVERLGGGWVAEEALAIAVYCALRHNDVRPALLLAVNHSGDSDSTGAICGNLLGAWYGETALPPEWTTDLEGRETILRLADDLFHTYAR